MALFPESWQMRDIMEEIKNVLSLRENAIFGKGCCGIPRKVDVRRIYRHTKAMGLLSTLFSQPWAFVATVIAFLLSLSVHEASHALAAYMMGDQTAQREGRLTLNPVAHVDMTGLLLVLLLGFGWGKPVPFNPHQLKYPKWGPVFVGLAGPASNILMAVLSAALFVPVSIALGESNLLALFLFIMAILNGSLALFNLIPVPPLDGSKVALALLDEYRHREARNWLITKGPMLLLALVIINTLLPFSVFSWIGSASQALFIRIATFIASLWM